MKIELLQGIEGAGQAKGLAVIIDVFRAFSLECYLFSSGVRRVLAVGQEETARQLKKEHPEYVLIGERGGAKIPGFEYGNSPYQLREAALSSRTAIHTTSAGTQGLAGAERAEELITASLVNARAVAAYIRARNPEQVSIVCMGLAGREEAPEDTLCGRYIRGILIGQELDMQAELAQLRRDPTVERFFLPENREIFPSEDYAMCTALDRFSFVLRAKKTAADVFEVTKTEIREKEAADNDQGI